MAFESIGTAVIDVIPSARGLQANLAKELAPASAIAAAEGQKAGTALGGGIKRSLSNSVGKLSSIGASFGVPLANELSIVGARFDQVSKKSSDFGSKLARIGQTEALVAAAGLAAFGVASVKAAIGDEQSQRLLATSLKNTTGATTDQIAATEKFITTQQNATGILDDDLRPALAQLLRATGDSAKAQDLLKVAMDTSVARGLPLQNVAVALSKAYNGNVQGLQRLGIQTKDASGKALTFTQVIESLRQKMGGSAAAAADTLQGKINILRGRFEDFEENVGGALIPKIEAISGAAIHAVQGFESFNRATGGVAGKIALGAAALPVFAFGMEKLTAAGARAGAALDSSIAGLGRVVSGNALAIASDEELAAAETEVGLAAGKKAAALEASAVATTSGAKSGLFAGIGAALPQIAASILIVRQLGDHIGDSSKQSDAFARSLASLSESGTATGTLTEKLGTNFEKLAGSIKRSQEIAGSFGEGLGNTILHGIGVVSELDKAKRPIDDTTKALLQLNKTDPSAAITAFSNIKQTLIAGGLSAGQVDKAFKKLEDTIGGMSGPTDKLSQAQKNLADAQHKQAVDILGHASQSTLAKDYAATAAASDVLKGALGQVDAATSGVAAAIDISSAAAERGKFGYLGLADSVKTAADALAAITSQAFKPIQTAIDVRTAQRSASSAVDDLLHPDTGSGGGGPLCRRGRAGFPFCFCGGGGGGGGGGAPQTATAAALEKAQKNLTLRDSERGVEDAMRGVQEAERQLAQARRDENTATRDVTRAQENLRTTLRGVKRDSDAARTATDQLTSAQNAAQGARLSVEDANRAVQNARFEAPLSAIAVRDAQKQLNQDRSSGADHDQLTRDQIALNEARLAAQAGDEAVRKAELDLSNAKLDAKQKTKDLSEAQRVHNGVLKGFPKASKEAKDAQDQLRQAQETARQKAIDLATAERGVVTAQDAIATSALALLHAKADASGALDSIGGSAGGAAGKMKTLQERTDNALTSIQAVIDSIPAADKALGHSLAFTLADQISILETYAQASPILGTAFAAEIAALQQKLKVEQDKLSSIQQLQVIFGAGAHGRASGGPVGAGGTFLIGEDGPELLVMGNRDGTVVPNHALKNSRPVAGGGLTINFNAPVYGEAHLRAVAKHAALEGLRQEKARAGFIRDL